MAGEVRALVIMILLASMVIIGTAMFYGSFAETYGSTGVDDISNFSSATQAQTLATNMRDSIKDAKLTNVELVDIPFTIITGGYNAFKLVFDTIDYVNAMTNDLVVFTGLPIGWAVTILTGLVMVIIVFAALGALLKWEV